MKWKNRTHSLPPGSTPSNPLRWLLSTCLRYRWLILSTTLLSVGGVFLWLMLQTPIYQASAHLAFEIDTPLTSQQKIRPGQIANLPTSSLATHIHALKSDQHLQNVARQITVLAPQGFESTISHDQRTLVIPDSWQKHIDHWKKVIAPFIPSWIPEVVAQAEATLRHSPSSRNSKIPSPDHLFTWLKEHVQVERIKYQPILKISVSAEHPAFAAITANIIATLYIDAIHTSGQQVKEREQAAHLESRESKPTSIDSDKEIARHDRSIQMVGQLENIDTDQFEKLQTIQEALAKPTQRVTLFRSASPPQDPISQYPLETLSWAGLIGLIVGGGLALLHNWKSQKTLYPQSRGPQPFQTSIKVLRTVTGYQIPSSRSRSFIF